MDTHKELLADLELQRHLVLKQQKCGIISYIDSINELSVIKTKESNLKRNLIKKCHVKKGGKERTISYMDSRNLWFTKMPDGSKLYAKDLDTLYDKLISWYGIIPVDANKLSDIFGLAITEKERTDNNNSQTIEHYRADYKRFITEEFGNRDIQKISRTDVKAYTQELVHRITLSKKAFLSYKGVLNLIFRYAVENGIIQSNPVVSIKNSVYLKSCDTGRATPEEKILSEDEIDQVRKTVRQYMGYKRYNGYFINGYAILFSIETGVRAAEIPALKWSDIHEDYIHIHAQQLNHIQKGGKEYYYAPWTKDEKGISRGGRKYPLTDALKALLDELRALQTTLGIDSDIIFCHEDGTWIKTDAYETCLRRLMRSAGMSVTNNHALRMSLNSNVFIGRCDLPVTERARLLGHSVETNLRHYSFASKDGLKDVKALLNQQSKQVTPWSPQNVVKFEDYAKRKTPENGEFSRVSSINH